MFAVAVLPMELEVSYLDMVLRLACALFVGAVIGTEREYTHRPAGMRTHILVSVGSCVVMLTSQVIFAKYLPFGITADPARLSAQVISGVGFLGAGTIMREGVTVKGLTTAASLWTVACLGIAAGGGFYEVALLGMLFALTALTVFEWLQRLLPGNRIVTYDMEILTDNVVDAMEMIHQAADDHKGHLSNFKVEALVNGYKIHFRVDFHGRKTDKRYKKFMEAVCNMEKV